MIVPLLLALQAAGFAHGGIFSSAPLARGASAPALARAARKMLTQGRYLQAEPLLEKRLELERANLRADPKPLAQAETELADLYAAEGRYAEAEELYDAAYGRLRPAFGLEDPGVAALTDRMGELYRLQGRYLRSEQSLRRALDARERRLGPEHLELADSLQHLGRLMRDESRYLDAEALLQRALEIRSKHFGGARSAGAARLVADLASLYKAQDRLEQAEPLYRKAAALQAHALGRRHPDLAATLEQAATVLRRRGEPSDAQAFESEAAAIRALNARDVPAFAGN